MDQIFQIGDFTFRMRYSNEVSPPPNFLLFTQMRHSDFIHAGEAYGKDDISVSEPEYTYEIRVSDVLPQPTGKVIARRPDRVVFQETDGTERRKTVLPKHRKPDVREIRSTAPAVILRWKAA